MPRFHPAKWRSRTRRSSQEDQTGVGCVDGDCPIRVRRRGSPTAYLLSTFARLHTNGLNGSFSRRRRPSADMADQLCRVSRPHPCLESSQMDDTAELRFSVLCDARRTGDRLARIAEHGERSAGFDRSEPVRLPLALIRAACRRPPVFLRRLKDRSIAGATADKAKAHRRQGGERGS